MSQEAGEAAARWSVFVTVNIEEKYIMTYVMCIQKRHFIFIEMSYLNIDLNQYINNSGTVNIISIKFSGQDWKVGRSLPTFADAKLVFLHNVNPLVSRQPQNFELMTAH